MTNPANIVGDAIRTSQELGVQVGIDTSEVGIGVLNELHATAEAFNRVSDRETIFRGASWEIKLRVTYSWEMH